MEKTFKLFLCTPQENKEIPVEWIEVITTYGNLTVLPGHAPMIGVLRPDTIAKYQDDHGRHVKIKIVSGIIKITREMVSLISRIQSTNG